MEHCEFVWWEARRGILTCGPGQSRDALRDVEKSLGGADGAAFRVIPRPDMLSQRQDCRNIPSLETSDLLVSTSLSLAYKGIVWSEVLDLEQPVQAAMLQAEPVCSRLKLDFRHVVCKVE